jgi:hypothetical protein
MFIRSRSHGGAPSGDRLHVGRVHLQEDRPVELRVGEDGAGMQAELVVLLLQHVHQQGRAGRLDHWEPVVAVQSVEHREDAHLGAVAATVVLLETQRLPENSPQIGHDLRIEQVEAQRLGDHPDDVRRTCRRFDLQRDERVTQATMPELHPLGRLVAQLDAEAGRQLAERRRHIEGVALAGKEDRLIVGGRAVAVGEPLAQSQAPG